MKRIYFLIILAVMSTGIYAQTDDKGYKEGAWVLNGVTGLNLSQTAMTNWSAGGENALSGNAYLNGSLTHKNGNWLWVTNLILDYGLSKTKSQGMRKTTDKIGLSTQLGYSTNNVWYYTLMGDLNTQFAKGYNYPDKTHYISNFFAPAYSNISLGMEYRPKSNYSVFLSPVSAKMTFVEDDYLSEIGAFGVDPGDRFNPVSEGAEQSVVFGENAPTNLELAGGEILATAQINTATSAVAAKTLTADIDVVWTNAP